MAQFENGKRIWVVTLISGQQLLTTNLSDAAITTLPKINTMWKMSVWHDFLHVGDGNWSSQAYLRTENIESVEMITKNNLVYWQKKLGGQDE